MDKERKNRNDYSVTAYCGSRKINSMKYVHNIISYTDWLAKNNLAWSVLNVYERRSGSFIRRFYKNDLLIAKP